MRFSWSPLNLYRGCWFMVVGLFGWIAVFFYVCLKGKNVSHKGDLIRTVGLGDECR